MSLIVQREFHLNGKLLKRGKVLDVIQQSQVENNAEQLRRCRRHPTMIPPGHEPADAPSSGARASVKKLDPVPATAE